MFDASPMMFNAVLTVVGLLLYALVWLSTREFPPIARAMARIILALVALVPLGLAILGQHRASSPTQVSAPRPAQQESAAPQPEAPARPPARSERGQPRAFDPEASKREAEAKPSVAEVPPIAVPPSSLPSIESRPPEIASSGKRGAGASAPPPGATAANEDWDVVPVYFGTDRVPELRPEPRPERVAYGAGRAGRLDLGRALVSVPKVHKIPQIERPWVYKVPFTDIVLYAEKEDPKLHFTLQEAKVLTREDFLRLVRERLSNSSEFPNHALVFIHGYNTTFDSALYRTAQIAYDLGFDGAPFVYSWPSQGQLSGYPYDRESAEQAEPHLRAFLELVTQQTGATSVSIIAHSMGNQLLLPVLRDLKNSAPPTVTISEIILAAPDVSRPAFENMARDIRGLSKGGITLYASANDRALLASRRFWSGERAGEVPADGPLVTPGVETIDMSALSSDMFGLNHSGFAERTRLLDDIRMLIQKNVRPPSDREPGILYVDKGEKSFWRYREQ